MPKHRQTVFAVVRTMWSEAEEGYINPVLCGAYMTLSRAEEVQGKYKQEMKERGLDDIFNFNVQTVTYYEE